MTTKVSDPARLAELAASELLDSPPEAAFDRFTSLASRVLQVPVALVSLVDENRQFFKSVVGLPEPYSNSRETPLSHSFCQHVVNSGQPLVISLASENPLVRENLAIRDLGVVAYAGIPLTTTSGQTLGSFCAIDGVARDWTESEIAILTDLAAGVMTEIELRMAGRSLRESLVKLRRLEAQRDDMTHMLVHDLRTPLTSLLVGLESIAVFGELNNAQQEVYGISMRGGSSLAAIVDDILAISKMESGLLALKKRDVAVAEIIDRAEAQVASLGGSRSIGISRQMATGLPRIQVDIELMVRALVNLLGNALKFTPQGGAIVVAAETHEDGTQLHLSVRDNGPGISPVDLAKIFDKFGTADDAGIGQGASTGLGLTFCKLAAEAHGGSIQVESQPGVGSKFTIVLPIDAPL